MNLNAWDAFSVNSLGQYLSTITDVLFGAQGVVLAHQYKIKDPLAAILDFLSMRPILENMALELYGLDLEGTSYGVGIGLVASAILMAKNTLELALLGIVIAFYLQVCEAVVKAIGSMNHFLSVFALPLAFFLAMNFYAADIKKFYILFALSVCVLYAYRFVLGNLSNGKIVIRHGT
jgi:hypothetical protein